MSAALHIAAPIVEEDFMPVTIVATSDTPRWWAWIIVATLERDVPLLSRLLMAARSASVLRVYRGMLQNLGWNGDEDFDFHNAFLALTIKNTSDPKFHHRCSELLWTRQMRPLGLPVFLDREVEAGVLTMVKHIEKLTTARTKF